MEGPAAPYPRIYFFPPSEAHSWGMSREGLIKAVSSARVLWFSQAFGRAARCIRGSVSFSVRARGVEKKGGSNGGSI